MSDNKPKRVKLVTPKAAGGYMWLNKPDTKFNAEGTYKVSQTFSAREAQPLIDKMEEIFLESFEKKAMARANFPYKMEVDSEGNETGNVSFTFKSSKQPKLYDSKGNPIKKMINVGNGSVIKSAISCGAYKTGMVTGVSAYLDAVQIIELVEFQKKSMFGAEDGYTFNESDYDDQPETDDSTDEDEASGNF